MVCWCLFGVSAISLRFSDAAFVRIRSCGCRWFPCCFLDPWVLQSDLMLRSDNFRHQTYVYIYNTYLHSYDIIYIYIYLQLNIYATVLICSICKSFDMHIDMERHAYNILCPTTDIRLAGPVHWFFPPLRHIAFPAAISNWTFGNQWLSRVRSLWMEGNWSPVSLLTATPLAWVRRLCLKPGSFMSIPPHRQRIHFWRLSGNSVRRLMISCHYLFLLFLELARFQTSSRVFQQVCTLSRTAAQI